jgi:hypothetical protein
MRQKRMPGRGGGFGLLYNAAPFLKSIALIQQWSMMVAAAFIAGCCRTKLGDGTRGKL